MEKITYDFQPAVLQNRGDGAWYYRWGIEQVQVGEEIEIKWKCHEVLVWETITADKITRAVVDYLWGNGLEQKLLNDYYGALEGVLSEDKKQPYLDFLTQRKVVKEEIDGVCAQNGIQKNR